MRGGEIVEHKLKDKISEKLNDPIFCSTGAIIAAVLALAASLFSILT